MKKVRNKFESKVETQLKKAKAVFTYESEKIPYIIASHYIPDFIITTCTGKLYIETKGYLRPEDKRKLLCVKRQHPNLDIRLCFYSLNKKYVKWCERNSFQYCVEKIPLTWLKGL